MVEQGKVDSFDYLEKGSLEETMIGPLWARAEISLKYPGVLKDPKAVEIASKLNYDFSAVKEFLGDWRGIGLLARARSLDNAAKRYIEVHPEATVINIGAGLDTTFYRIDNKKITYYDLDMPEAIEFRKKLIPETSRSKCIASSVFDNTWMENVKFHIEKGIFFIAGGFFYYFSEDKVRTLFRTLSETFPDGAIAFDTVNKLAANIMNKRARRYDSELSISLAIGNPKKTILNWSNNLRITDWYTIYDQIEINPDWPNKTRKMIKMNEFLKIAKIVIVDFTK